MNIENVKELKELLESVDENLPVETYSTYGIDVNIKDSKVVIGDSTN